MLNLAHALDDLVEAVLQVQEEAVPAFRQGRHQTWHTDRQKDTSVQPSVSKAWSEQIYSSMQQMVDVVLIRQTEERSFKSLQQPYKKLNNDTIKKVISVTWSSWCKCHAGMQEQY